KEFTAGAAQRATGSSSHPAGEPETAPISGHSYHRCRYRVPDYVTIRNNTFAAHRCFRSGHSGNAFCSRANYRCIAICSVLDSPAAGNIFDPFVTTKSRGMGLGLAISQMIIERHEGRLSVSSADPHGAIFRITLPQMKSH